MGVIKYLIRITCLIKEHGFLNIFFRSIEKIIEYFMIRNYSPSQKNIDINIVKKPLISIVVPVYNTPNKFLEEMIESVLNQSYDNLELCLFEGGGDKEEIEKTIRNFMTNDKRVKYIKHSKNCGIAINTNKAIEMATGEYIAFLDHDDLLTEDALMECIKLINVSDPDVIYSDEDKVSRSGRKYFRPHYKPDWSPDTLKSYNYICHFMVVKRDILSKVNYFREGYDGSQDYDLILRISNVTSSISHIPKILYHWRVSENSTAGNFFNKSYAFEAGKKALVDFFDNNGISVSVSQSVFPGSYNINYPNFIVKDNQITIICIGEWNSIYNLLEYCNQIEKKINLGPNNFKLYVLNKFHEYNPVNNDYFESGNKIIMNSKNLLKDINEIIQSVQSEYVLFIDQNIRITLNNCVNLLISNIQNRDTVILGPKLMRRNRIFSYGIAITNKEIIDVHQGLYKRFNGYFGRAKISQNVSAVASELFLVKRSFFEVVGGFNVNYQELHYSLLDLCMEAKKEKKFVKIIPNELGEVSCKVKKKNKVDEQLFFGKFQRDLSDTDPYFPFIIKKFHISRILEI